MKHTRRGKSTLRNERGSVLLLVAISLVVLIGMAALAIDLGMLYTARSEAQRAAEAGAHAGAGVFLFLPGDEDEAKRQAEIFAERNQVRWTNVDIWADDDIQVIVDSQKVRVWVERSQARANPVATFFAKILGFGTADVRTRAAAQVWPGDRAECLLPFAVPDRWEVFEDGAWQAAGHEDVWEGPPDHNYEKCDWDDPNSDCTGYSMNHVGSQIVLKMADPGDSPAPGWYYPVRLPGMSGANDYREAIMDCWPQSGEYSVGDPLNKEPGNMRGPTRQAFSRLTDASDFTWSQTGDGSKSDPCPINNAIGSCDWEGAWEARLWRPVAMFEPPDWENIDQGMSPVPISNLGGVFVEGVDPDTDDILVRIVPFPGFSSIQEWTAVGESLIRTLRIVE